MNKIFPAALVLPALLLAACSTSSPGKLQVKGQPLTSDPAYVLQHLIPMLPITSGCREKPKSVSVALVSKSDDIRTNAAGTALISGSAREAWNFDACGRDIPMYVTYSFFPDGKTAYKFAAK
ncbi:hypothetical protein KC222_08215 [Cedecea davisae]|uniref:Lipoprotein n=1 Tax=Cedecea davisae TaxID=158484 RepID=A0ABS6DFM5_9ENTR|nr:hypothetical protein [Cedecea davisae]MBU4681994.1 hypothetical protein [Cedecea davisae]MBU4686130.1 hypothetical protein [Cedecea davisae]